MNLLDHPLIRKYFGTIHTGCPDGCNYDHFEASSKRVLQSMQEPIIKGTRYLDISQQHVNEMLWIGEGEYRDLHPFMLRLPDRFQPSVSGVQKQECIVCDGTVGEDARLCDEHGRVWLGRKPAPANEQSEKPEKCMKCYNPPCSLHSKPKDADLSPAQLRLRRVSQVEEKINEIMVTFGNDLAKRNPAGVSWSWGFIRSRIRELVALARRDI